MKRILIFIFLISLILTSSCSDNSGDKRSGDKPLLSEFNKPEISRESENTDRVITVPYISINNWGNVQDGTYTDSWTQYLEENFGIDLDIQYGYKSRDCYEISMAKTFLYRFKPGLVMLPSNTEYILQELMADDEIRPLSSTLKNNKSWNALPEEMRMMYEFNGEIWAIPDGYQMDVYSRLIRSEWLSNLGVDKPETFDEFMYVNKLFVYNDPDGDGEDNTLALQIKPSLVIDIFNSSDCFLQYVNNRIQVSSVAYNRYINRFSDCMMTDSVKKPLLYLQSLKEQGLAKFDFGIPNKIGSTAMFITSGYSSQYTLILGFEGKRNNPVITNFYGGYIVQNIRVSEYEADDMINRFVDAFYGNAEGYMASQYGIEGSAFTFDGKAYIERNDMHTNKMPYIVGFNPLIESEIEIDYTTEDFIKGRRHREYWSNMNSMDIEGLFFLSPRIANTLQENASIRTVIPENVVKGDQLLGLFEYIYGRIMNGNISVEEGIDQYRKDAVKSGITERLQQLNSTLAGP